MVCTSIFVILVAILAVRVAVLPIERPATDGKWAMVILGIVLGGLLLVWGLWGTVTTVLWSNSAAIAPVLFAVSLASALTELALGGALLARSIRIVAAKEKSDSRSGALIAIASAAIIVALSGVVLTLAVA